MSKIFIQLIAAAITASASAAYAQPSDQAARLPFSSAAADVGGRNPTPAEIALHWDQYGFTAPTKPAQMRVNGRNGVSVSGTDYATALSLVRSGAVANEGRSVATGKRGTKQLSYR